MSIAERLGRWLSQTTTQLENHDALACAQLERRKGLLAASREDLKRLRAYCTKLEARIAKLAGEPSGTTRKSEYEERLARLRQRERALVASIDEQEHAVLELEYDILVTRTANNDSPKQ